MLKSYELASEAKPDLRQIKWQETEFYALISYGLPVFSGKQYGDGFTPPAVFWPEDIDTDSWCETAKNAGMKGIVYNCKDYDGFCLWQTEMTDYGIKKSKWQDGTGDMVRLVADSCKKHGLKFGISIAPWDRHEKTYGSGEPYDDWFCGLLTELLTNYGEIFYVRLDGHIGVSHGKMQAFDWGRYYSLIRRLMPNAVIAFRGPDVRWYGNDRGVTRTEEWSSVPSWHGVSDDGTSVPSPKGKSSSVMELDIGSRKAIKNESDFIWYPCEVFVPMRRNLYFSDDDKYTSKTKDKLLTLYFNTVGRNSCLMLGLSPNKRGVLDEIDSRILNALGHDLKVLFFHNLLQSADVNASSELSALYSADNTVKSEPSLFWRPTDSDKEPEIIFTLEKEELFDKLVISENITNGQHVEEFTVSVKNEKGKWKDIYSGTAIGYKHICCLKAACASEIKITFKKFRRFIEIANISLN